MALIAKYCIDEETFIYIWEIEEPKQYFINKLISQSSWNEELKDKHPQRQREYLVARYLTSLLSPRHQWIYRKDVNDKPYLENSKCRISISHSANRLAYMISNRNCGIDIQKMTNKIYRIADKFIDVNDYIDFHNHTKLDRYHFVWGDKEAMYKGYGKKKIRFKENIRILDYTYMESKIVNGKITIGDYEENYILGEKNIDNFKLVYAKQVE